MIRIILALCGVLLAPACAHAAPQWVDTGSCIEPEGAGTVIYGVGAVRGPDDTAQTRAAAANRARNEVARQLGPRGRPGRRFVAARLTGIEIADYYTDGDGTVYALAVYRPEPR